jgi:hypothetical protein
MMRNNRQMGTFAEEIERGLASADKRNLALLDAETGLYSGHVERYRATFGPRFKVLVFEEWMADIPRTLRELLRFLEVDHAVGDFDEAPQRQYAEVRGSFVRFLFGNRVVSRAAEALIPFRIRKFVRNSVLVKPVGKPQMDAGTREFLVRYYRDDVRRLEGLLGRPLPWRNFAATTPAIRTG